MGDFLFAGRSVCRAFLAATGNLVEQLSQDMC